MAIRIFGGEGAGVGATLGKVEVNINRDSKRRGGAADINAVVMMATSKHQRELDLNKTEKLSLF